MNNKSPAMSAEQIAAAAQRALIAADPKYFSWPPQDQEQFRATLNADTRRRAERVLLDSILGIKCSLEEVNETWSDVPLGQLYHLNWALLLASGIGDDYIYLNDYMATDASLLDFDTLYEYDYDSHLYQESARARDFPGYVGTEYCGWSSPTWVRLLIDEQLCYATLTSLARHFMDELEQAGGDLISELIPYEFVDGPNDGKEVDGGFVWDKVIDANGLEGQLDELKSRWYDYQKTRIAELGAMFADSPSAVYLQDNKWDDDYNKTFIFSNIDVLKNIRWRHFISDCNVYIQDAALLTDQLASEIERATSWLKTNYQDVMDNYDPAVVKFRKKRQIVMSPGAAEDFRNFLDDEPEE